MGFGFLPVIFKAFLWCLGLQSAPDKGSSGFGGDDLVRKRPLSGPERAIKVASTTLFVAAIVWHFADFLDFLFEPDSYWVAIPTAAWVVLVFVRRSLPMDAEAIGTGLWTFAPFVCFALFYVLGLIHLSLPWTALLWQAGGVAIAIAYGLIRDISKEMDKSA
jgi:hypothetical protein